MRNDTVEKLVLLEEADVCSVCWMDTKYWYPVKDVPLCFCCARKTDPKLIPTKRQWLVELGYELPRNWKAKVAVPVRVVIKKVVYVKITPITLSFGRGRHILKK